MIEVYVSSHFLPEMLWFAFNSKWISWKKTSLCCANNLYYILLILLVFLQISQLKWPKMLVFMCLCITELMLLIREFILWKVMLVRRICVSVWVFKENACERKSTIDSLCWVNNAWALFALTKSRWRCEKVYIPEFPFICFFFNDKKWFFPPLSNSHTCIFNYKKDNALIWMNQFLEILHVIQKEPVLCVDRILSAWISLAISLCRIQFHSFFLVFTTFAF